MHIIILIYRNKIFSDNRGGGAINSSVFVLGCQKLYFITFFSNHFLRTESIMNSEFSYNYNVFLT